MSVNDTCPQCGEEIEPSIAALIPAGDTGNGTAKVEYEERDCPHCGTELKRAVGGVWVLASETELP